MTRPSWDERAARAEELAGAYTFASELLRFYAVLLRFQKSIHERLETSFKPAAKGKLKGLPVTPPDLPLLLPALPALIRLVQQNGPAPLAEFANDCAQEGSEHWAGLLTRYWQARGSGAAQEFDPGSAFFARAFLEPYAEWLAGSAELPLPDRALAECPFCQSRPQVGVLRPEGDGGKRFLICSFCGTEWEYRRILCPACGEADPHKLPVYTAAEFDYIRVEACQTCNTYIKTVDLTKNGLAVPVVDELATPPLDLWACEKNYTKLQANLLGI